MMPSVWQSPSQSQEHEIQTDPLPPSRGILEGGVAGTGPPLGAPFLWLAPFVEGTLSDATCAPCSATAAAFCVVSVASLFFIGLNPFCSVGCASPRSTIHHSPWPAKQAKSSGKA